MQVELKHLKVKTTLSHKFDPSPLAEAQHYLQEAISHEVKPTYVLLRAFQSIFAGDYIEALNDFKLCVKLDPQSSDALFYTAKTMLDMLNVPKCVA